MITPNSLNKHMISSWSINPDQRRDYMITQVQYIFTKHLFVYVSCSFIHCMIHNRSPCSWLLTTLVLVKIMEVNFPFFLPVRHVMEEFIVIQSTIFVLVITINDVLLK